MVIMMDEFQNIGQKDPTFPAVIQYIWDTVLKGAHVMLVISGSSIPQMSAQVLEYGSPLYGRRTAQIMLGQLSFSKCSELYGAKSAWDQVMFYSVTGGVPKYVKTFGGYRDVYSAVEGTVLNPDSYLYDEVMASLQSEVTDIGSYASILGSIASGHRKLQDMADDLGLKQTGLTNYLKVLMDTGLVERDVPVTDDDPFRSKKGLYRIADRMTAFWFRYVYPHSDLLGRGEKEKIMNIVRSDLPFDTMRSAYVEICTEKAWDMASEGSWDLIPDRIGGYWGKDVSADIVGIDYGAEAILVGTCVCSESPAGPEVLEDLRDVGGRLMSVTGAGRVEYVVFSISGFEGEWPDDVDLVEGV